MEADEKELEPLNPVKSEEVNSASFVSIGSEEFKDVQASENFNSHAGHDETDTDYDEDELKVNEPLLKKGPPADDNIELSEIVTGEFDDNGEEIAETNIDDDNLEDIHAAENLLNADQPPAASTRGESNRRDRIRQYLSDNREKSLAKLIFIGSVVFIVLLAVLMGPFIYRVEYNKLAVATSKLTGKLYNKALGPGIHFLLPWTALHLYERTALELAIEQMSIFTTDKLRVTVNFKLYYFLDINELPLVIRKFGSVRYQRLLLAVCRSELTNLGQQFSINDYRTRRIQIRVHLKEKLKKRLKNDYHINLLDLFFDDLKFGQQINELNLKRMINGLLNEEAEYHKTTGIVRAETEYLIKKLQNEAKLVVETAQTKSQNEIVKIENKNLESKLELVHASSLNNTLRQLNFYGPSSIPDKAQTQRIVSFCYVSSLINSDKVKIIPASEFGIVKAPGAPKISSSLGVISFS